MKLIALIDDDEVIEKILRHLGLLWPEQTEPSMPRESKFLLADGDTLGCHVCPISFPLERIGS